MHARFSDGFEKRKASTTKCGKHQLNRLSDAFDLFEPE
jgi:hypothetical protein